MLCARPWQGGWSKNKISDRSWCLSFQLMLSGEEEREVNAWQFFVMGTLRNFHHSSDLLRWTHVLLSQPMKGDKMPDRQQINSLQVLFTIVFDYPVLQTSFPWPWLWSPVFPSFPGRGPSSPSLMVIPRSASCSPKEINVSGSDADPELQLEERLRVSTHPSTSVCSGTGARLCLRCISQLQRDKAFLCSCM